MPQVVDPAQPPINIKKKNTGTAKAPHLSKPSVAYPVPVMMETTLKEDRRIAVSGSTSFASHSHPDTQTITIANTVINHWTWLSLNKAPTLP